MNGCEACIEIVRRCGRSPQAGILLALLWLRGGVATMDQMFIDFSDWRREHGEPTWEFAMTWAATQDIESNIVKPLVELNSYHKEGRTC